MAYRWVASAATATLLQRISTCNYEPTKLRNAGVAGVAVGRGGVYVADKTPGKGRVCVLDFEGSNPRERLAMHKKQSSLWGLAVDGQDNCFVVDNALRKIWTIAPDSTEPVEFASIQDYGKNPLGAACDSQGNVFIAEMYSGSIIQVASTGESSIFATTKPDGPSRNGGPIGIAIDTDDNVFVSFCQMDAQFYNPCGKVLRYDRSGKECTEIWGAEGRAPKGLAVTSTGLVVVADALQKELVCLAPSNGEELCCVRINSNKDVLDVAAGLRDVKSGLVYVTTGDGVLSFDIRAVLREEATHIVEAKKAAKADAKAKANGTAAPTAQLSEELNRLRKLERMLYEGAGTRR
jgi:sugar lactone lactonase YvrE